MPRNYRRRSDMARIRMDRRSRRDMRSMQDMRGRNYGYYGMGDMVRDREHSPEYDYRYDSQSDYERGRSAGQQSRQYSRDYRGYGSNYVYDSNYMMGGYYPMYDYARGGRRSSRYDRGSGDGEYLTDEELMDWSRDLLEDVEDKDKGFLTRENITKRAKEMGVGFKDYTEDELVVATLMTYTDYKKTLGTGNLDLYVRLGKDWLEDEDSELKGGEKLAAYYDEVICAD